MGKRNVKKRREEERQQSISGHNKKFRTGGLNRKERQNLMDFGKADGDPLSLMDGEDQGFEGKTWTFDANNEVISKGNENETQRPATNEEAITLLGSTTSLSSVQLGKKRVVEAPKLKKQVNTFSKLLSNLKRNKKVVPEVIEEVKVIAPSAKSDDPPESEAEIAVEDEDELQSEVASDEEAVEVEEASSDEEATEEATVQVEGSVYRNHFGNDSYGEKELEEMVAKATEKKWKTQQIFPTDQTTTSDVHIFLSTLEGQETKIDALVKHSSATPPPLVLEQLAIKPRLHQPWRRLRKNGEKGKQDFGLEEGKFFFHLSHYRDIFFPLLTPQNNDAYKEAYVLHALNHVFKTRDTILKSNFKMAKAKANGTEASEVKDSSFTRPKVLILLPFRSAALKVVKLIYQLSGCEQQENRKRFLSEFSLPEGEDDPISRSRAPDDHKITFAGNTDDCFKIGIKVTRKSLKLYSPFYGSDIIVASPLGLRLIVGDPEGSSKKKKDHDFLSSVELLVLDQADHLLMQNWDHTTHILRHTNLVPKDAHGCDFSRLKSWYLNSHAPHLRQTILLSQMATPDLNHLFHGSLTNVAGQVRFRAPNPLGSIADTSLPARHFFSRVTCRSHAEADDARFNFFKDSVLPAIRRKTASGGNVLLFIPSYFDFTRVRNYLTEHEYQFGQASEYTDVPTQTRDRMAFSRGKTKLLLYTGRCHFYRRFRSKGAHQIVFYGLPEYAAHYPEIINSANAPDSQGLEPEIPVTVLFTVYDILKLERILGDARAQKACHGAQATLVFS